METSTLIDSSNARACEVTSKFLNYFEIYKF